MICCVFYLNAKINELLIIIIVFSGSCEYKYTYYNK